MDNFLPFNNIVRESRAKTILSLSNEYFSGTANLQGKGHRFQPHEAHSFWSASFSGYMASFNWQNGYSKTEEAIRNCTVKAFLERAFMKLFPLYHLLKQLPQSFGRNGCSFICWLENECVIKVCTVKIPSPNCTDHN